MTFISTKEFIGDKNIPILSQKDKISQNLMRLIFPRKITSNHAVDPFKLGQPYVLHVEVVKLPDMITYKVPNIAR